MSAPGQVRERPAFDTRLLKMPHYSAARADFLQKEEEATKKVEQLKRDLGEKWDEVTGKKSGG